MPKYCGECGFALDKEYNFCPNCGSKIEAFSDIEKGVERLSHVIREELETKC